MQEAIFELGTVELLNCFLAICNFVTFFDFFWWPPNFKLGSFFQHIKMLWNCNVTDRIVDSVRFRILERLYWDDRWIYFELSNVNVEKRLLLLMGCGVLYHFNGEKTHLNYSTLLVPCLPFRPRHINQNKMCCANRIVQGNRLLSELYRLPSESEIYFRISQLGKNLYLKTWNGSRTTKREHNQKESIETFFKLGMIFFKSRIRRSNRGLRGGLRNA